MLDGLFSCVVDRRNSRGRKYLLEPFLCAVYLAILSNATSFRRMQDFIDTRLEHLRELLGVQWAASPSWVCIRDILLSIELADLETAVRQQGEKYSSTSEKIGERKWDGVLIAIDGKALRGSAEKIKDVRAQQIVSVFSHIDCLILAHADVSKKSNEIPSVQMLLEKLDLKGAMVTMDALHCQAKTLKIAKEKEVDVLVQVKANQKYLYEACSFMPKFQPRIDRNITEEKGHGRIEIRTVSTFKADLPTWLYEDWKDHAKMAVRVEREVIRKRGEKPTFETHWWLSTKCMSAAEFQKAIRGHWTIENNNHHVRDTTLQEDACRVRTEPGVLARIRSMALNCLRNANVKCIKAAIYKNSLSFDHLMATVCPIT